VNPWWWALIGAVAVLLLALYLSMTAGRMDRLHRRLDASETALDVQLLHRSALVLDLASTAIFDPASTVVLADSAHAARAAQDDDRIARALIESNLTRVLAETLSDREEVDELGDDAKALQMLAELRATCVRVQLSRRFLNDGVRACRQVRKQRFVRWFNLAGRTPWPETFEMDDTPPPGLALH